MGRQPPAGSLQSCCPSGWDGRSAALGSCALGEEGEHAAWPSCADCAFTGAHGHVLPSRRLAVRQLAAEMQGNMLYKGQCFCNGKSGQVACIALSGCHCCHSWHCLVSATQMLHWHASSSSLRMHLTLAEHPAELCRGWHPACHVMLCMFACAPIVGPGTAVSWLWVCDACLSAAG